MVGGGARQEGKSRNLRKHAVEKSDAPIVPMKPENSWVTPEERVEGRGAAKGKFAERNAFRTQSRQDALTTLARIGERAKERQGERFTTLLSHIKVPLLTEAYERLRRHAASGVDGQTWESYGEELGARLLDLENRIQRGSYHPQPSRRVHIAKSDGRTRPLGIPSLEDKIVQQAARMLLEPIYESSALMGFVYGFRPSRSQHDALDALYVALHRKVDWVLDADIRSFFDTIDHGWMHKFLEHRIADRRMVRLLMKWLHAGVMEEGVWYETQSGTPQGGIISPLLANVYLHYVLDLWVQQWRRKHARGQVYIVRYADDFVMGFEREQDARAMREALAVRLESFGLQLHPDKTRVIRFGRTAQKHCAQDGRQRPETFEFLGFTHICAMGPTGRFWVLRRTSSVKSTRKLDALRKEMRLRMHEPVIQQQRWLVSVLRGHARYYGVPGNFRAMATFRNAVEWAWHRRLQRRSQRAPWNEAKREQFTRRFPLPAMTITHPHPLDRFDRRHARP